MPKGIPSIKELAKMKSKKVYSEHATCRMKDLVKPKKSKKD